MAASSSSGRTKRQRAPAETAAAFTARQASAKQLGAPVTRKPHWVYLDVDVLERQQLEVRQQAQQHRTDLAVHEAEQQRQKTQHVQGIVDGLLRQIDGNMRDLRAVHTQKAMTLAAHHRAEQKDMLQHQGAGEIVAIGAVCWRVLEAKRCDVGGLPCEVLALQNVAGERQVRRADEVQREGHFAV